MKDVQGRFVAVEVESEFPNENDYGVWQAVVYKHVMAAEFGLACEQVRGMLVAPAIPDSLKQKCRDLGVGAKGFAILYFTSSQTKCIVY
jgi:hypothetical protein